jgi:5-methylcytosine-specific restriction endonuclease McrA
MSEDSIPQKRCPKCAQFKPLEMFGKHKGKKDGLTAWCKECLSKPKTAIAGVQPSEKRCKKCGETKPIGMFYTYKYVRDGTQAQCKQCQLAAQKIYQDSKRDALIEYKRAWRVKNRDHHREYSRAWYYAHPEHCSERSRAWRENNRERKREANRAWNKAHPDVIRAKTQRRLAKLKDNGGVFTHEELTAMRIAQAGICAYCKRQHDPDALTIDHIIPISQGGRHEAANICLACGTCNSSKGDKTPEQWVRRWYMKEEWESLRNGQL